MMFIGFLLAVICFYLFFVTVCVFFLDYFPVSRISYWIRKYVVKDLE